MKTRILFFLVMLSGCAEQLFQKDVIHRASEDMHCPEDQVTAQMHNYLRADVYGCGQHKRYQDIAARSPNNPAPPNWLDVSNTIQ